MITLTLENIPEDLDRTLKRVAKEKHQPITEVALQAIRQSLARFQSVQKHRDLSAFFGGWSNEDADNFEKNLDIFERIDEEVWNK